MNSKAALRTPGVMRQAHEQLRRGQLPVELLDPSIGRSWQRCVDHGLRPDAKVDFPRYTRDELRDHQLAHCRLVELAEPLVKRVADDLRGCQLLLASPDSTVLKTYGKRFSLNDDLNIVPGMNLDERWFGTNAPALAVIERQPVLVKASEHMLFPDNPVSCVAAPLFDMTGECLGLIDLTFDADHPRPEIFLRRVRQLTGALEQQLFMRHYQQRWVLQIHASMAELDSVACGLVAINDDGLILAADPQAVQWLNRASASLVGSHIEELLGSPWALIRRQCEHQSALLGLELTGGHLVGRLHAPDHWQPAVMTPASPVPPGRVIESEPRALEGLVEGWPKPLRREALRACRALGAGLPVLLQGETGTGKEQLARALHGGSRPAGPFVALNCAAIPENLIEAELFGYGEGAFTGARKGGYAGRLVQASGGTLLLDEIGDMPLSLQARLLRVLQERVVTPLGDHREVPIDIHVIAASHRDLEALVDDGEFREDLFYRLAGVVVELPALTAQENLAALIDRQWVRLCRRHERDLPLDRALRQRLASYRWPGNWRELEHCLEVALVGAEPDTRVLTLESLSPRWRRKLEGGVRSRADGTDGGCAPGDTGSPSAAVDLRELERLHIERTLAECGGNFTAAARALGVSRSTLYRRLG